LLISGYQSGEIFIHDLRGGKGMATGYPLQFIPTLSSSHIHRGGAVKGIKWIYSPPTSIVESDKTKKDNLAGFGVAGVFEDGSLFVWDCHSPTSPTFVQLRQV